MEQFKWDESLSVGVQLIDDQHKMLIDRLNALSKAIDSRQGPNEITRTLGFLIEYTDFHFSAEEKHMAKYEYPGLQEQQKTHAEFKQTLKNLEEDFLEEGATHSLADAIDTLLVNWLVKHIKGLDAPLGKFLQEKGIVLSEDPE